MPDVYLNVTIQGLDVTDSVERVEVEESDLRASLATLTFRTREILLADVAHEGLEVEVDLGRPDAHALVFRGVIISVRCHFPSRGAAQVVFEAADASIRLARRPRTKRWWNITLTGIVTEIARAHHLAPGRIGVRDDPTFDERRPVQQVEETDLALLYRLAADYDCKVYVVYSRPNDMLSFVSTLDLLTDRPAKDDLVFNDNMTDLVVTVDSFATDQRGRLVTTDADTGHRIEAVAAVIPEWETTWTPDGQRISALEEAAVWVLELQAKALGVKLTDQWSTRARPIGVASRPASSPARVAGDHARRLGQTAYGKTIGSIWLSARSRVQLLGYGGRWETEWYLAVVRHEVDLARRSFTTSFVARR